MIEQGTPEWHQLRLGKVTASRVADILAKTKTGPSASRQNYLIELAIQRVTNTIQESYSNSAMEWGFENEAQARVAYEVASHNFVDQVAFVDHPTGRRLHHPGIPIGQTPLSLWQRWQCSRCATPGR